MNGKKLLMFGLKIVKDRLIRRGTDKLWEILLPTKFIGIRIVFSAKPNSNIKQFKVLGEIYSFLYTH